MSKSKKDTAYYYDRYGAQNAQNNQENADGAQNAQNQSFGAENTNANPNADGGGYNPNNNSGGFNSTNNSGYNPNGNNNGNYYQGYNPNGPFGYSSYGQNSNGAQPNEREMDIMDIKANKLVYILSFLWILFFLPLVVCPNAKNARFYANQGLVLLLAGTIVSVAVPCIGWLADFFFVTDFIWSIIGWSLRALMLLLTVLGIVWVAQDEKRPLPVIGKITLIK